MNVGEFLKKQLVEAGVGVTRDASDIRNYLAERVASVGTISPNDPNLGLAMQAAADSVFAYAAERAVDHADTLDRQLFGTIIGILGGAISVA